MVTDHMLPAPGEPRKPNSPDSGGIEQPDNCYEHFLASSESGPVGARGSHADTAIKKQDVARVAALVFDLDAQHFLPELASKLRQYLREVLPQLELRQTSDTGNLHAILHFKNPIGLQSAIKLRQPLRRLLLSDPSASILMKARVIGSRKVKDGGESYVVKLVQQGTPVSAKQLLKRLTDRDVEGNNEQAGVAGWKRRQFRALMTLLTAANKQPLWDGRGTHAVCPIHGSGANAKQCAVRPDLATCDCFGDCADGNGHPKSIGLADILEKRVFTSTGWEAYRNYYVAAPATANGRPIVFRSRRQPVFTLYSAVIKHFAATGLHFIFGNTLCEIREGRIEPISTPDAFVGAMVSHMEIATLTIDGPMFERPSRADAGAMLNSNALLNQLPRIELFTEIPVYNLEMRLVEPGYNEGAKIYCSGGPNTPSRETTCLTTFLHVVSFRDAASAANYLGLLLTAFLPLHFCGTKPVSVFEANRVQVGKTMCARCAAAVSTNQPIRTVTYNPNDEEFEKRLAAEVLRSNYVLIDNAKSKKAVEVSSAVLERSITDRQLGYRQLGYNRVIERPNTVTWMISMNNARLSPDLTDRGLPIRLFFEGDPTLRDSNIGDPEEFFVSHISEIRAELLGMIEAWRDAGCPGSSHRFRFRQWAQTIGGILAVNGFDSFLGNLAESRVDFDPVLSALQSLAERSPDEMKRAAEWLALLKPGGLLPDVWANAPSELAQAANLGKLFKAYRGQLLQVGTDSGSTTTYRLASASGHSGVAWGFLKEEGEPGERGERPNWCSPPSSPPQSPVGQKIRDDGERGERKTGPESLDLSSDGPPGNRGGDATLRSGPRFRSPRSPQTAASDVSSCHNKDLTLVKEVVKDPVNVAVAGEDVHHIGASIDRPGEWELRRSLLLDRLHDQHPCPTLVADTSPDPGGGVATGTPQVSNAPIAYDVGWDGRSFQNGILAVDTETTSISDDETIPELVLTSASDGDRHLVMVADHVADFVVDHHHHTLIFHNSSFDFWVLHRHFAATGRQDAIEAIWAMAAEGRLRDTMLLDQLVALARTGARPVPRDLGTVAAEWAGLRLNKTDPYRTRFGEIRGRPLEQVEPGFLDYAVKDAAATIHSYAGLSRAAEELRQRHAALFDPALAERYGLLTEVIQVQGAIALAAVTRNGMAVDIPRMQQLRTQLESRRDDSVAAVEDSVPDGVALSDHPGVFQRDHNNTALISPSGSPRVNKRRLIAALAAVLAAIGRQGCPAEIPRTPRSGELSLKAEYWMPVRQHHPFVDHWLQLNELTKLIQFTRQYTSDRVHPRYSVLVRTGRTSCSGPNIQQLPRSGGVRECFVASPGYVLLAVDYGFIELRTLAAVCEFQYGSSKLADVIRDGVDPHCYTAAMIRGISLEEFMALPAPERKADRQKAKAVNFGVPGGLGVDSLMGYAANTYGVVLSSDEAEALRDRLIHTVYPELAEYLRDAPMAQLAAGLGVTELECWNMFGQNGDRPDWLPRAIRRVVRGSTHRADGQPYDPDWYASIWERLQQLNTTDELGTALAQRLGSEQLAHRLFGDAAVATLTGRIRAAPTFPQARNTPFQGLASDGAKLALFELARAGYRVVAFLHDEVLVELPADADHDAEAKRVVRIMCENMRKVTGAVPIECGEPVLMTRWAKDAEPVYDEQGKLTAWHDQGGDE